MSKNKREGFEREKVAKKREVCEGQTVFGGSKGEIASKRDKE